MNTQPLHFKQTSSTEGTFNKQCLFLWLFKVRKNNPILWTIRTYIPPPFPKKQTSLYHWIKVARFISEHCPRIEELTKTIGQSLSVKKKKNLFIFFNIDNLVFHKQLYLTLRWEHNYQSRSEWTQELRELKDDATLLKIPEQKPHYWMQFNVIPYVSLFLILLHEWKSRKTKSTARLTDIRLL